MENKKLVLKSDLNISFTDLHDLLQECQDLKSLEVKEGFLSDQYKELGSWTLNMLEDISFDNLEKIKISAVDQLGLMFASEILNKTFPNVKEIDIRFDGSRKLIMNQRVYVDPFHTVIFSFIGRHWATLKHVKIQRDDIRKSVADNIEIQLDKVDEGVETEIIEQLKKVQLYAFEYYSNECDLLCEFVNELFKAQRNLMAINLHPMEWESGLMDLLPEVCQQCSETLTFLSIDAPVEEPFSCDFLANCAKLDTVSLYLKGADRITNLEFLPRQLKGFVIISEKVELTENQTNFIAEELVNLEELKLKARGPKIDLGMFKKFMGMPRLNFLYLDRNKIEYASILVWIVDRGQGWVKYKVNKDDEMVVEIDRSDLDSSRI